MERIESGKIKADNARLNIKFNSVDPSKVTKRTLSEDMTQIPINQVVLSW